MQQSRSTSRVLLAVSIVAVGSAIALPGCGDGSRRGSAPTSSELPPPARNGDWSGELLSSGGCKRPEASVVEKSNADAIVWTRADRGAQWYLFACSRDVGKVFLLERHRLAADVTYSPLKLTAKRYAYELEGPIEGSDEETFYQDYSASLKTGKVLETDGGSMGGG